MVYVVQEAPEEEVSKYKKRRLKLKRHDHPSVRRMRRAVVGGKMVPKQQRRRRVGVRWYWKCERSGISRSLVLARHAGAFEGLRRMTAAHQAAEPDCGAGLYELRVSQKPFRRVPR